MASTAGPTASSNATSDAPSRPRNEGSRGQRGRGRGRGRGGLVGEHGGDSRQSDHRGGRRGRGGNRGGFANHETTQLNATSSAEPATKSVAQKKPQPKTGEDGEEVEEEVCFICAAPIEHNSVAPCNHRTCHICALRMRALYKTKDCPHCRVSFFILLFGGKN